MKSFRMQFAAQTVHAFLGRLRLYRLWIALALVGLLRVTKRVLRWFWIRLNHLMFALCVLYHLTLILFFVFQKASKLPGNNKVLPLPVWKTPLLKETIWAAYDTKRGLHVDGSRQRWGVTIKRSPKSCVVDAPDFLSLWIELSFWMHVSSYTPLSCSQFFGRHNLEIPLTLAI